MLSGSVVEIQSIIRDFCDSVRTRSLQQLVGLGGSNGLGNELVVDLLVNEDARAGAAHLSAVEEQTNLSRGNSLECMKDQLECT